ncbi:MAG: hypothetical protein ACMG6S_04920 [Byssovorax sp.]
MAISGVRTGTVVEQRSRSALLRDHLLLSRNALTMAGHAACSTPATSTSTSTPTEAEGR